MSPIEISRVKSPVSSPSIIELYIYKKKKALNGPKRGKNYNLSYTQLVKALEVGLQLAAKKKKNLPKFEHVQVQHNTLSGPLSLHQCNENKARVREDVNCKVHSKF